MNGETDRVPEMQYPTSEDRSRLGEWGWCWDDAWEVRDEPEGKPKGRGGRYDLGERLLEFSVEIIRLVEDLPEGRATNHIATQLLRAGTSPCANHGEAQAAESARDFIHKLRVSLKELHETDRWLRMIRHLPSLNARSRLDQLINECDQLIRIFAASIRTAGRNA